MIRQRRIGPILEFGRAVLEGVFMCEVEEEVCNSFIADGLGESDGSHLGAVDLDCAQDLVL